MKLDHVLCRQEPTEIDLENYRADELKKITRFWVGIDATKLRKDECLQTLKKVFKNPKTVVNAVAGLPKAEQTILGIYSRFGPLVSGALLSAELQARGLVEQEEKPKAGYYGSYGRQRNAQIAKLRDKLLLVSHRGYYDRYRYHYSYSQSYPSLTLHPNLWDALPPAPAVAWKSSGKTPRVQSRGFRSSAEVALELWQVAEALQAMGNWKVLKGGSLSKGSQNRLHKLVGFPTPEEQPEVPPDYESLFYELLSGLEILDLDASEVDWPGLQQFLEQPTALQAREWVRSWMEILLWQDGIGVVPDRDNEYEPVRIDPDRLGKAQELLVWSLSSVAHSVNEWRDLETFLVDLWQATQEDPIDFYWGGYAWQPEFSRARNAQKLDGDERRLAYWLLDEGQWAANAVWVTLWTLGLIERGHSDDKAAQPCFRLTDLGRQVFGAPDVEIPDQIPQSPCLVVQPNSEVVAYLDAADSRQICTLARFSDRASAGGQVQTFRLSRETVYHGLESGLSAEEIQSFLKENSKSPVPDNVQKSLAEWAGRRESLVLRTGISLAVNPQAGDQPQSPPGRELAEPFTLLKRMTADQAAKNFPDWALSDHKGPFAKVWQVDEHGALKSEGQDSLSQARLEMLAVPQKTDWRMTEQSVTAAKNQGVAVDQMLKWLADHLQHAVPPLLETAIRSWTGRTSAFLGPLHLLQVTRTQARDAILISPAFRPLLAGHIPPDWFLIQPHHLADVKRLLKQLGIRLTDSYQLPPVEAPPAPAKSAPRKARRRRK